MEYWSKADKTAAWELHIELLFMVGAKQIILHYGKEKKALGVILRIPLIIKKIIKRNGYECIKISEKCLLFLKNDITSFANKWNQDDIFDNIDDCEVFYLELIELQKEIIKFNRELATIAGIKNLIEVY